MKTKWANRFRSESTDFDKCKRLMSKLLRKYNIDAETYKLGDLYCGELCYVLDKQVNNYVQDGVSDITFCLKPLTISIFKYEPAYFYKHIFVGGDYYLKVTTGRKYVSNQYNENIRIIQRDIIVNSESCKKLIDKFGKEVGKLGYNENSVVTRSEIRRLEKMLTQKYLDYMHGTRFVR